MDKGAGMGGPWLFAVAAGAVTAVLYIRGRAPAPPSTLQIKAEEAEDFGRACGLDIGGTLAKLVMFESDKGDEGSGGRQVLSIMKASTQYGSTGRRDARLELHCPSIRGRLHFIHFATARVEGAVAMLASLNTSSFIREICATGGGAHKFERHFKQDANVALAKQDEMDCLVKGLTFLIRSDPKETYTMKGGTKQEISIEDDPFPFILVNIGSGVSILRVDSEEEWQRVSGTSMGGATFYGLASQFCPGSSFEELLEKASTGDNKKVDMLVGDIYGGAYDKLKLPADVIAANFGKLVRGARAAEAAPEDFVRSLLIMVSNNIGQVAHLIAKNQGVRRIIFAGTFLRNENAVALSTLAYAVRFWSAGAMQGLFLRHEGYCGAVGAFLKTLEVPMPDLPAEELEHFRSPALSG